MPKKVQSVVWVGSWVLSILMAFTVWAQETPPAPKEKTPSDKAEAAVAVVEGTKIYERDLQMTIREMSRQFGEKEAVKRARKRFDARPWTSSWPWNCFIRKGRA